MVTDSGQAHRLAEEVKKTGKILVIGYNTPCTPEFIYLRELVRSKELGKLETVTGALEMFPCEIVRLRVMEADVREHAEETPFDPRAIIADTHTLQGAVAGLTPDLRVGLVPELGEPSKVSRGG